MKRAVFRFRLFTRCTVPLCGTVVLLLFAYTSLAMASEESTSDPQPSVVTSDVSAEGRQMLIVVVTLTGVLIGMERLCSWRLGVIQRRAATEQKLAAMLPPISAACSPLPSWSAPVRAAGHAGLRPR